MSLTCCPLSWQLVPVAYNLQTSSAPPLFNTQKVSDGKHRAPRHLSYCNTVCAVKLTHPCRTTGIIYKEGNRDIVSLHASLLLTGSSILFGSVRGKLCCCYWPGAAKAIRMMEISTGESINFTAYFGCKRSSCHEDNQTIHRSTGKRNECTYRRTHEHMFNDKIMCKTINQTQTHSCSTVKILTNFNSFAQQDSHADLREKTSQENWP